MTNGIQNGFNEVSQFKECISAKNRQLLLLKHLSLLLAEIDDEKTFGRQAVPLIEKALTVEGGLILYVEIEGETIFTAGDDADALKLLCADLGSRITPGDSPLLVDFVTGKKQELGGSKQSALLIAPIIVKSNTIGFLGGFLSEEYRWFKDEKPFLLHLGEILGTFFCYLHLKRNLQSAKMQLENRCQNLQAVYNVSRSLGGHLDLQTVLNNTLDTMLAQEVLNVENKGGLFLLNEKTGQLDLTCYRNIDDYLLEHEKTIELGHCLCGRVAQSGEIIISTDCFCDRRHDTRYEGMIRHGHINLPLKTERQILGVLFLYLPGNVRPTEGQIDMLQTISGQLSVAIENAKLFEQVIRDELTGLYSRKFLMDRLKEEIKRLQRTGRTLSLAMIDIDRFKKVNDEYGHQAGDKVLQQLALILMEEIREVDMVARFGGEEFIFLLPETNVADAMRAMERLRLRVENHAFVIDRNEPTLSITISVGISGLCSDCPVDAPSLINAGDMALYRAKQTGRNRVASAGACQC